MVKQHTNCAISTRTIGEYMRLLLLFLFTVNANAAFIPIPSAPINYYAVGVLGKGELLTSNGTSNGTQAACADDELLVWDATEVSGVKCEAKPSGGVSYICRQIFLRPNLNAVFDTTVLSISQEIGKVYVAEVHISVTSGNFPQGDLMQGTKILMRVRGGGVTTSGSTTAPYESTSTILRLRALTTSTYFGTPIGDLENTGNHIKLCEIVGATAPNTTLN
jgi:hypothetical protein